MAFQEASEGGVAVASRIGRMTRGDVLGMLTKSVAQRGYALYQNRNVSRVYWSGGDLEANFSSPGCIVHVNDAPEGQPLGHDCSVCGHAGCLCEHAAAALLQWLDIRTTMLRMGPGSIWRAHSRHPFLAPARSAEDRIDLSHLTGVDLRSALELQLSLQKVGTAVARLIGREVEIEITLPSKDVRTVVFSAALLPSALPVLRSLPRLRLDEGLEVLELSEARLHPVLAATWDDNGIELEPGYSLADGAMLTMSELEDRIFGRWALLGCHLCRLLDPATPLVPFFRKGRQTLEGREALRFLNLDHQQLLQHPWYRPQGQLARFRQPIQPKPDRLVVDQDEDGLIRLKPLYAAGDHHLGWDEVLSLLRSGFMRIGKQILRAPDLTRFEELGFKLGKGVPSQGLTGDRLAFIRLVAESRLEVEAGPEDLQHLVEVLRGSSVLDIPDPPGLESQLRPYQKDGVAWLWSRCVAGVGALLADDMGLGKTHQIMGLFCLMRQQWKAPHFLVVCPRGVLEHWEHLLGTFAPTLQTRVFHGPERSLAQLPENGGVVLTTYDIVIRSREEVTEREWDMVVFDEAQRIKNPRTKSARAARKIVARFRAALSGTPLENRLTELWSVVDLILPGYLGSEKEFRSTYRNPSKQQLKRLRRRLSVLTLRRLKEQVLSDLPEKVEDLRYCRMTPIQRRLYGDIHREQSLSIEAMLRDPDADIPYMHIFALLTRLKQICDHPSLVDSSVPLPTTSGKLDVFDEILDEALAANHQVVIFSQYVTMIDLLSRHLEAAKIEHLILTGNTKDRGSLIRRFNSGQHERVLLASLLAGGVGIDLTGASVVIHYDRWWNPAKENQATDRVHRMGQKRFVQVFKLVTRDSIEERIDELIRSKTLLMEQVVAPTDDVIRTMSRAELAALLGIDLDAAPGHGAGNGGAADAESGCGGKLGARDELDLPEGLSFDEAAGGADERRGDALER